MFTLCFEVYLIFLTLTAISISKKKITTLYSNYGINLFKVYCLLVYFNQSTVNVINELKLTANLVF